MKKEEIRRMARDAGLSMWDLSESQDICFLPKGGLHSYLERQTSSVPGPIRDRSGSLLGTHKGFPFYTIGQRKGLGIPYGEPVYVIRKDRDTNSLVVGKREELCRLSFSVEDIIENLWGQLFGCMLCCLR